MKNLNDEDIEKRLKKNSDILIRICGQVKKDERVLVITDTSTENLEKYLVRSAYNATKKVNSVTMPVTKMHGAEPPKCVAEAMLKADVIFEATQSSMAHTRARLDAIKKGARYLSLADYSIRQLTRPCIDVDYMKWARISRKIKEYLDGGHYIKVISSDGTNLSLNIDGRVANSCPGVCLKPGTMGSPPDIETNIAPIENKSEGRIVVNGSIPCREIGLLKKPIELTIKYGNIVNISSQEEQKKTLQKLLDLERSPKRAILAEFGIGLNPKADLVGLMLEDEGCLGTVHFGFGSNATIGGKNSTDFHLDFVIRNPTVVVDKKTIMKDGKLQMKGM